MIVHGKGLHGLNAPSSILDVGNSGTTTRLISGILAGQPFNSELSGDESLNSRPMKRIIEPLTSMGANIASVLQNGCAPLYITPAQLHGIHYDSPVASAQVKSCLLLAGLYADGETSVTEPSLSRNHTELMLRELVLTSALLMRSEVQRQPPPSVHVRICTDRRSPFREIFLLLHTLLRPDSSYRIQKS